MYHPGCRASRAIEKHIFEGCQPLHIFAAQNTSQSFEQNKPEQDLLDIQSDQLIK
jgi:hypothetical protein